MITTIKEWNMIKESLENKEEKPLLLQIKDDKAEVVDTKDWYVDSVIDILTDPTDIDVYEALINTAADMSTKVVKQGDELYLTVLLKPRNNSTINSQGEMGIAKVKITKVWQGLGKLAELQKKGKLN